MSKFSIHPLTPDRWSDFETLFGPSGGYSGCWCTWWRQTRADYDHNGNEGNKQVAKNLVEGGAIMGLLGYLDDQPVAWVSVAPRPDYPSLQRSPVLKAIDDTPVWSLVCMFVGKAHRGAGLAFKMIEGAAAYASANGGHVLEAYPRVPKDDKPLTPDASFMGTPSMFEAAGFEMVARPSAARAVYRLSLS